MYEVRQISLLSSAAFIIRRLRACAWAQGQSSYLYLLSLLDLSYLISPKRVAYSVD